MTQGDETPSLKRRFLGSAAWTGGSRVVLILFGLGVTALLARLLDPADYGLLGMCMVVIGLLNQARDFGIGPALVQRREVTAATSGQAFSLALLLSFSLLVLCWLLARPVALFYGDQRIVPLFKILALGFPLTAFQVVPLSLLRRELRLKGESIARTLAAVVDGVVTIVLALAGYGVWALVLGNLTSSLVLALTLAWYQPWRPWPRWAAAEWRSLLRFGSGVTLSSFLWYIYSNADFLIIGRRLGSAALGTYTMAWNLAKMPWNQIWISLSPMVLPLFSRSEEAGRGISPAFLRLGRGLALFTFPALAGLALVAGEAVPVFLGAKWTATIPLLRLLALYGIARSLTVLLSPVLLAGGAIRREVAWNAACALFLPAAFLAAARLGLAQVAAVWTLVYPVLAAALLLPPALRISRTTWHSYLKSLAHPAVATMSMVLAVGMVRFSLHTAPLPLLASEILTGLATYLLVLRWLEGPALLQQIRAMMREVKAGV